MTYQKNKTKLKVGKLRMPQETNFLHEIKKFRDSPVLKTFWNEDKKTSAK